MVRAITSTISVTAITLFNLWVLPTAQAAEKDLPAKRVEATLYGGYRFGGNLQDLQTVTTSGGATTETRVDARLKNSSSYGLAINWEAEPESFYEIAYSKQSSTLGAATPFDVSVEYLQFGGYTTFAEPTAHVIPYFLLTVGAARFVPDATDLDSLTKFAAVIGGGVKVPLTSHLALRVDARLYAAFFQGQHDVFCRVRGASSCSIHLRGGTLVQPDVSLGLSYGF